MRENEIKKLYSMLDSERHKTIHQYRLKIHHNGINIYPKDKQCIYVLDALIKKISKITPDISMYINFNNGYLRLY